MANIDKILDFYYTWFGVFANLMMFLSLVMVVLVLVGLLNEVIDKLIR